MTLEFQSKTIETTANGHLVNSEDWSEDLARHIASLEGIELTDQHWDVINYLRDEYFNQGGNQPNERTILKAVGKLWNTRLSSRDMYDLFPKMPSKQGGKIAGLPESRRKGGY
jgi:tRNA 2-thiouridine synthesizing protein E